MMATMATRRKGPRLDPELEKVRRECTAEYGAPDINQIAEDLIERTRRIHVGFLFDRSYGGDEAWSELMLHLCATPTNAINMHGDWQAFCYELGFGGALIKSIANINPDSEDPVTNTLKAFCQHPDATLSRVVSALYKMDRRDILQIISQPVRELADRILRDHEDAGNDEMDDSGYSSRHSGDQDEAASILIPEYIPTVPSILKTRTQLVNSLNKIKSTALFGQTANRVIIVSSTKSSPTCNPLMTNTTYVNASPVPQNPMPNPEESSPRAREESPSRPRRQFSSTVMLTFAEDGFDTAKELARVLRQERTNGEKCGVLMLQENLAKLNEDPDGFVRGCFPKFTYVVPILTPGYLRSVHPTARPQTSLDCADANFTRSIYKMMCDEYRRDNCMNHRIRCIIPDVHMNQVAKIIAVEMLNIFSAYHRMRDAEKFATNIIKRSI